MKYSVRELEQKTSYLLLRTNLSFFGKWSREGGGRGRERVGLGKKDLFVICKRSLRFRKLDTNLH